ncbi:MAG: glycosyltransferase family 2 protein [Eubacteriales bacterium]
MGCKYSVVVPAFNEEEVIEMSYERLSDVMKEIGDYEIIFINDGSRDNTFNILKSIAKEDKAVKVLSFSRNFGHQEAVSAGLEYASGDAVIIIDADLQDPPEAIPHMIKMWQKGTDIVYGKREKRKGETFLKKFTAWGFYRFLNALGAQKIPRDTGDFRLIDRKVVNQLKNMPEKNRFLRGMSAWTGFSQEPYIYVRDERAAGKTKYNLKKMAKLAGDGITSFSNRPLKIPIVTGCIMMPLSLAYLIVSIVLNAVNIWDSMHIIFSVLFLMVSLIFIFLGIMGIYIGRIFDEVKGRPTYIIDELINI